MRNHLPESVLRSVAESIASRVTFRMYINGNSHDVMKKSTASVRSAIYPVAYGALLGLNYGEEGRSSAPAERAILTSSEFTLMHLLPDVNTYDTIYNPLRAALELWRLSSGGSRSSLSDYAERYAAKHYPDMISAFCAAQEVK